MTKNELIEKLQAIEGNFEIVLATDAEGNWYERLRLVDCSMYDHAVREVGWAEITDELRQQGYTEEDILEEGVMAIVLWP